MKYAKRFRKLRRELNLTQRELAEKLGCSQSSITAYENGRRMPSLKTVKQILRIVRKAGDRFYKESDFMRS